MASGGRHGAARAKGAIGRPGRWKALTLPVIAGVAGRRQGGVRRAGREGLVFAGRPV
jgi:hypothetical protein